MYDCKTVKRHGMNSADIVAKLQCLTLIQHAVISSIVIITIVPRAIYCLARLSEHVFVQFEGRTKNAGL